jgi:hypothetical protein
MLYMEDLKHKYQTVINLFTKHHLSFTTPDVPHPSTKHGISDILLYSLCMKNNPNISTLSINIAIFLDNNFSIEQIEHFITSRIHLLSKLFSKNQISFFFNPSVLLQDHSENKDITDFTKLQPYFNLSYAPVLHQPYVVFHTKCRFTNDFNYTWLKLAVYDFVKQLRSKYTIILLGERFIPNNQISTLYDELVHLKYNNTVVDLTQSNENIEALEREFSIIHNAKVNICFGIGSQLINCLCFGKRIIHFSHKIQLSEFNLNVPSIQLQTFSNINVFLNQLYKEIC